MSSVPVTGNPAIDTMTKVFDWLGRQVDQVLRRPREDHHPPSHPHQGTDRHRQTARRTSRHGG